MVGVATVTLDVVVKASTPVVVLVVMMRYRTRDAGHRSRKTYRWPVPVWFCG